MDTDTLSKAQAFRAARAEVSRRVLRDGASVVLSSDNAGSRWTVEREADGSRETVFETPFADEASSVFDAYDGRRRDWHRAYLPIGKAPVDHASLTAAIHSVGTTVEGCVMAFLLTRAETLLPSSLHVDVGGGEPEFQWSATFVSEGTGTSFVAAGRAVPGGFVMTWWK